MNPEEKRIADLIRSAVEPLSRRTPPQVTVPERTRPGSSWTLRALGGAAVVAVAAGAVALVLSRHSSTSSPAGGAPAATPPPPFASPSAPVGTDSSWWFYAADPSGQTVVPVGWQTGTRGTPFSRPGGPVSPSGKEFLVLPNGQSTSPLTIVDWSGHVLATVTDLASDPRDPAMVVWSSDDDGTLCAVANPSDVLGVAQAQLAVMHPGQPTRVAAQIGRTTNGTEYLAGCSTKTNVAVVLTQVIPNEGMAGGGDTRLRVISLADGHVVADRALPANTLVAMASPDGRVLAMTHGIQTVVPHGLQESYDATTVIDVASGRTLIATSGMQAVRFSSDDLRVVLETVSGPNGPASSPMVEVRELSSGRTLMSAPGTPEQVATRAGDATIVVGIAAGVSSPTSPTSPTSMPARQFHEIGADGNDSVLFDVPAGA